MIKKIKQKRKKYSVIFNYMDKEDNLCTEDFGAMFGKDIIKRFHIPRSFFKCLDINDENDVDVNVALDYVVIKRII